MRADGGPQIPNPREQPFFHVAGATMLSMAKRIGRDPRSTLKQRVEVRRITETSRQRDFGDRPAAAAIGQFSTTLRETPPGH
jgi:hypothetical protein